ncbi:MAG: hypothetical protein PHS53_05050 [Candidatus Pacebacteria bacterium]|nr:hypothetical protein [Candidatus Paceibacterota bacterium]MDD5357478.1 hypothetical protein [Candidatus Paceibacterota bacterium]
MQTQGQGGFVMPELGSDVQRRKVVPGTQLFFLISAQSETTSARVLRAIEELAKKKGAEGLTFSTSQDVTSHGLVLCDVPGRNFSLRYSERGSKYAGLLPIGADLTESRIEGVAANILAMVLRGEGWRDRSGVIHPHPCDKRRVKAPRPWQGRRQKSLHGASMHYCPL